MPTRSRQIAASRPALLGLALLLPGCYFGSPLCEDTGIGPITDGGAVTDGGATADGGSVSDGGGTGDGGTTDGGSDGGTADGGGGDGGGTGDGGAITGGNVDGPPNVLLLVADDLGVEASACFTEPDVSRAPQPNIEALCARGTTFLRTWANPASSPTRATLLTGRYGHQTGVGQAVGNDSPGISLDEFALPQALDEAGSGYTHAVFGKWHLNDDDNGGKDNPNLMGWNHFSGTLDGELDSEDGTESYFNYEKVVDGSLEMNDEYATTETVDDALEWLAGQDDTPWVVWMNFHAPHQPWHLPPADLHSYDSLSGAEGDITDDPVPYFQAMVEAMDTEIGRMLAGLGPQLDNTVVIYIGDNGTFDLVNQDAYPDNHGKFYLYQGGVHVPLIIAGPGIVANRKVNNLVDLVDLYPTTLEVAGVDVDAVQPVEKPIDGISLWPMLTDAGASHARQWSLSEIFGDRTPADRGGQAITSGRLKYIRHMDASEELYDLTEDPYETSPLDEGSLDKAESATLAELRAVLDARPLP